MESESRDQPALPGDPVLLTSYHVRRARGGDRGSLEWLIARFTPLLRAAADYRLGKALRPIYDPEDIVQDAWAVALPRLSELEPREERYTPVLLKFLSTILIYRINNLVGKHLRGKPRREGPRRGEEEGQDPLEEVASRATAAPRKLERAEARELIAASLAKLEPRDRELIILRGIEQLSYKEVAAIAGGDPPSLAVRYQRALAKLRRELPGSIYEEFGEE